MASLGNASALTPGATENRVWEKSAAPLETRQAEPSQTAGRHQGNGSAAYDVALDSLLAAEETVTLYHGTTTSAARNILGGGFRAGEDNAVFFGEDFSTAKFFGESRIAETGANSGQVLRYTMPQSLAEDLGLTSRQVLGEFRGAPPIDIPGSSGFERILNGGNIDAFNQAVRGGQISVKPIRIGY